MNMYPSQGSLQEYPGSNEYVPLAGGSAVVVGRWRGDGDEGGGCERWWQRQLVEIAVAVTWRWWSGVNDDDDGVGVVWR
ncbi:hypothetical protein Tco_0206193 [Tanacetum coccineum]